MPSNLLHECYGPWAVFVSLPHYFDLAARIMSPYHFDNDLNIVAVIRLTP